MFDFQTLNKHLNIFIEIRKPIYTSIYGQKSADTGYG